LTSIEAEQEEPEAPEWLRQEMDEALEEVVEPEPEARQELAAGEVEAESAMDIHEVEEPTLEEEPLKLDSELAGIFEEEADIEESEPAEPVFEFEEMPEIEEWSESASTTGALDPTVVDEATQEDLAWIDSLGEVDPDSWLEAEVEATSPELATPEVSRDSGQKIEQDVSGQEIMDIEAEAGEVPEVETIELLGEVDGVLNTEHLQAARGAIAAGNLDTALNEFGTLLQQGEGLPYLIAELQTSISNYGEQPRLQRLLGDAYVQNGQLKKAIEVYRQALDNL
jgi:tetratricopeptide (TPR) repeat protein